MKFASLNVESPFFLAPMGGYTDIAFRIVAKLYGAGITFSELISTDAIYHRNKKTFVMLEKSDVEQPFIIQLFGSNPDIFLYAAQTIEGLCDAIDINAGCPVRKVIKAKAGAYLLHDQKRLFSIIDKLKKHIRKPIGIKLRKGFKKSNESSFYKELENRGINYITIHSRLRDEYFSGKVDYNYISMVRNTVNIDVVANGAIDSLEKLKEVKRITNCDFFMIGQAALSRPVIFKDFIEDKEHPLDTFALKNIMLKHFSLMCGIYGNDALVLFRKYFHRYIKGFKNAKKFNNIINHCNSNQCVVQTILNLL